MALISTRECLSCGLQHDLFHHQGVTLSLDNEDDEVLSCPACGSTEDRAVLSMGQLIMSGGEHGVGKIYPYFDRALGCEVRSAGHRAQLCRERGLVPVDGDIDLETDAIRRDGKGEAAKARMHAQMVEYLYHGDTREAMDILMARGRPKVT